MKLIEYTIEFDNSVLIPMCKTSQHQQRYMSKQNYEYINTRSQVQTTTFEILIYKQQNDICGSIPSTTYKI